jgi:O-antigen/teichoic acid export membrane protein
VRRAAVMFGVLSSLVCAAVAVGLAQADVRTFRSAHDELLIVAVALLARPFAVAGWFFQARQRLQVPVFWDLVATVVACSLRIVVTVTSADVRQLCWLLVVESYLGCLGVAASYVFRRLRRAPTDTDRAVVAVGVEVRRGGSLVIESGALLVSAIAVIFYLRLDQLMMGWLSTRRQLGLYSSVATVAEALYFVPVVIMSALLPVISRAYVTDRARYRALIFRATTLAVWAGLGVAVIGFIAAPYVVRLLYGATYADAALPLRILFLSTPFAFLGIVESAQTVNEGLQVPAMARVGFAAALNIGINLLRHPALRSRRRRGHDRHRPPVCGLAGQSAHPTGTADLRVAVDCAASVELGA